MLTPDDVRDIVPFSIIDRKGRPTRTIAVEPFLPDGFIPLAGGIQWHIAFNTQLYPVLGRVLAVAKDCVDVKPGDVVTFRPNNYDEVDLVDGRHLCFMRESACEAILEGYDDQEIILEGAA